MNILKAIRKLFSRKPTLNFTIIINGVPQEYSAKIKNLGDYETKALAGSLFSRVPNFTSASVISTKGEQILKLAKNPETLQCIERINK